MRRNVVLLAIVALGVAVTSTAPAGAADPLMDGVRAHLLQQAPELGVLQGDLEGLIVTDRYTSKHNGVTHIYLRQTVNGAVEVINA